MDLFANGSMPQLITAKAFKMEATIQEHQNQVDQLSDASQATISTASILIDFNREVHVAIHYG